MKKRKRKNPSLSYREFISEIKSQISEKFNIPKTKLRFLDTYFDSVKEFGRNEAIEELYNWE